MANRLAGESSPYLLQHADNPVDWYPWGPEAFAAARERNVPVHLSVGYFACHWCHVMAHESFEDPAIADTLNRGFVNIKVDRQERPDVDEIYQRVVQMMGQSGGWPLTVFLTPAQEPFFAGTYFPPADRQGRPGFPRLLGGILRAWRERQHEVRENCEQFLQGYAHHDRQLLGEGAAAPAVPLAERPLLAARALAQSCDAQYGGLAGTPKFPNACALDLLLRLAQRTGEPALREALGRALDGMAAGGIRDHLGGGFARYSVDARWEVPHFEKMLYDNGQLAKLYADAGRALDHEPWRAVARDTIAYVQRDLAHPGGGFYASEDADSEGEEGRFYVWSTEQVIAVLGEDDGEFALRAYGITPEGNFSGGRTVLQRRAALDDVGQARLADLRQRLLAARCRRVRPGRDDSVLAGWNGLMIQGLCAAWRATGEGALLTAAREALGFVRAHLAMPDGGLYRTWRDGVAAVPGFLDDYAYLANAAWDLYECGLERADLDYALALVDGILGRFWDGALHYTPADGEALVHRPRAPFDSAWPSGQSEACFALWRAHAVTGAERYGLPARQVWEQFSSAAARNALGFSHLLAALEFSATGPATVLLAGDASACRALAQQIQRSYLPGCVFALAAHVPAGADKVAPGDAATAYVCRAGTCHGPVTAAAEVVGLLT